MNSNHLFMKKFDFVEKLGVTLCGLINQAPIKVKGGGLVIPLLTRNAHE